MIAFALVVIPVKTGIQSCQYQHGFRVFATLRTGMTGIEYIIYNKTAT